MLAIKYHHAIMYTCLTNSEDLKMTDLERVEQIEEFVLALVLTHKKVTVKSGWVVVNFEFISSKNKYYAHTDKASASSELFNHVFSMVKHTLADHAYGDDIEIIVKDKVFAVIK